MVEKMMSVILLAGGKGVRIGGSIPKQFRLLGDKPLALHSFDVFFSLPEVREIVIVCEEAFQCLFKRKEGNIDILFASPGIRRQDSVYQGLQQVSSHTKYICIHDSARPFPSHDMIQRALKAAEEVGAAAVGMPLKYTIKECEKDGSVKSTPKRERFWEIQTPQIIQSHLLKQGFEKAIKEDITVTDDLSLVELLSHPVKLVEGSYKNIKVTTPEDFLIAKLWL